VSSFGSHRGGPLKDAFAISPVPHLAIEREAADALRQQVDTGRASAIARLSGEFVIEID